MVFENVGKNGDICPSVGMRLTNESVRANFGSEPFRFAIEEHIRAQRDAVWGKIMTTPIDWSLLGLSRRRDEERQASIAKALDTTPIEEDQSRDPLRKLVLAYLAHHGYARTARAFQAQCTAQSRAVSATTTAQPQPEDRDGDVKMAVDDTPAVARAPDPSGSSRRNEFGFDEVEDGFV